MTPEAAAEALRLLGYRVTRVAEPWPSHGWIVGLRPCSEQQLVAMARRLGKDET